MATGDGELVVLSGNKPHFYKLQKRWGLSDSVLIERASKTLPATLMAFDLLQLPVSFDFEYVIF